MLWFSRVHRVWLIGGGIALLAVFALIPALVMFLKEDFRYLAVSESLHGYVAQRGPRWAHCTGGLSEQYGRRGMRIRSRRVRSNAAVGVLSIVGDNWPKWMADLALYNHQAYARRHGYQILDGSAFTNISRPVAWAKLTAARHYLDKVDWVFYLDADALFMNPEVPLETFMSGAKVDFVATADSNGLNSGAWLIRSSPWSRRFLERLWAQEHLVRNSSLPFMYEQRAFHHVLREDPSLHSRIRLLPSCAFNSQWRANPFDEEQFVEGDFVLHLAGFRGFSKLQVFWKAVARSMGWCAYPPALLEAVPDDVRNKEKASS